MKMKDIQEMRDVAPFKPFTLHLTSSEARADLLAMTPHGWRASAERRAAVIAEPLEVTVAIRYDWIEKI